MKIMFDNLKNTSFYGIGVRTRKVVAVPYIKECICISLYDKKPGFILCTGWVYEFQQRPHTIYGSSDLYHNH